MTSVRRKSLGLLALALGGCATGSPAELRPEPLDLRFEAMRDGAYVFRLTNNLPAAVSCLGFGPVPESDLEGAIPFPVVESWDAVGAGAARGR